MSARGGSISKSHDQLVRSILQMLDHDGIPCSHTGAERVFGPDGQPRRSKARKGWADVTACIPGSGRIWLIDAKTGNAKLNPDQKAMQAKIEAAGGAYDVIRNLSELENCMLAHGAMKESAWDKWRKENKPPLAETDDDREEREHIAFVHKTVRAR